MNSNSNLKWKEWRLLIEVATIELNIIFDLVFKCLASKYVNLFFKSLPFLFWTQIICVCVVGWWQDERTTIVKGKIAERSRLRCETRRNAVKIFTRKNHFLFCFVLFFEIAFFFLHTVRWEHWRDCKLTNVNVMLLIGQANILSILIYIFLCLWKTQNLISIVHLAMKIAKGNDGLREEVRIFFETIFAKIKKVKN